MIPPFHWWRTVFWLIPAITVYTIVLGAVSLASNVVDRRGHAAHWCARTWSWLILATTGVRVHVQGVDRVPRDGAYVFVGNHQSIYDIPILFSTLPFQLRIIAKASLGFFPVLGWHLRYTGHLLVDRGRPGAAALNQVAGLIERGHSLLVFPEGTRSTDGRVGRFRGGVFLMAVEAGLPVVPVAVIGSRHVMRKGRLMTCPGEVEVVVHDPLPTSELTREDVRRLANRARDIVRATVKDRDGHVRELERGYQPVSTALRGALELDSDRGMVRVATEIASIVRLGVLEVDGVAVTVHSGGAAYARPAYQSAGEAEPPELESRVAMVRSMYRRLGIDPTKTRPSSEALLRRLKKGLGLPRINSLVDVCNGCSVEMQLPYGLYDADAIAGSIEFRIGLTGEEYDGIRKGVVHLAGRPALFDDRGPFGNPTSDSARTMVTPATTRALIVVYAPRALPVTQLDDALTRTAARVREAAGGVERRRWVEEDEGG